MKDQITTIQTLLKGRNPAFDTAKPNEIKLVRHINSSTKIEIGGTQIPETVYSLYKSDRARFLQYQSEQMKYTNQKCVFDDVKYIVVFIGEVKSTARFVGVYTITGVNRDYRPERVFYEMEVVPGFEILEERVIIDWGKAAVSWNQWYYNIKEVVAIDQGMDNNQVKPFISYADVILKYDELKRIIEVEDSEWKSKLKAVNCIYLIQDTKNGMQYIGSTYGKQGIWGRWTEYARTGHGNNKELIALLNKDKDYASNFQWCILETLPYNITDKEAVERESMYKTKFRTREFGYNNN